MLKAIARFAISLWVLVAVVMAIQQFMTDTHGLAMKASETCWQGREQHLTLAQAFPTMQSERDWERDVIARSFDDDNYRFHFRSTMPMCRYKEERWCWMPMLAEQKPCSEVFPLGMPVR